MNDILSNLNGKSIVVHSFLIERYDEILVAKMELFAEDERPYSIDFNNISNLSISSISYPFQICGFEILDYSSRGYDKDSRFFVNDYEDGKISFYCENFDIFEN